MNLDKISTQRLHPNRSLAIVKILQWWMLALSDGFPQGRF